MQKNQFTKTVLLASALCWGGCDGFLDLKPEKSLVIPTELNDFQAILDNTDMMNSGPVIHTLSGDDFYLTEQGYNTADSPLTQNCYVWADDVFGSDPSVTDWNRPYSQVFYANVVLEGLDRVTETGAAAAEADRLRGAALFYRANAFYNLLSLFSPHPGSATVTAGSGIPLKTSSRIREPLVRAEVNASYERLVSDLEAAAELLPEVADLLTRPSRLAVDALLARVYLSVSDYGQALAHANAALARKAELLDYNGIAPAPLFSIPRLNREVIYHQGMLTYTFAIYPQSAANPELVALYGEGDLRKDLFFRNRGAGGGLLNFMGNYTGNFFYFSGLTTAEMYLIAAECAARMGDGARALELLDRLWHHRMAGGAGLPEEAWGWNRERILDEVLAERRRELAFRGTRWTDLKRFSLEPGRIGVLERRLGEITHRLPPDSPRYVFPIPAVEVEEHGFVQNSR